MNVHRYTITRWIQKNLFPAPDAGNKYKKETVRQWIKAHWSPGCQCGQEPCVLENQDKPDQAEEGRVRQGDWSRHG